MTQNKPAEEIEKSVSDKLDFLINEISSLKEENKKKDEKIQMLVDTADKNRIAVWDSKNPKKIGHTVKVSTIEGKIITSWRMLKDVVKKEPNGNIIEQQIEEFTFEDGEKTTLNIYDISSTIKKILMDVVSNKKISDDEDDDEDYEDSNGVIIPKERKLKLRFNMELIPDLTLRGFFAERDGKEIIINDTFIN